MELNPSCEAHIRSAGHEIPRLYRTSKFLYRYHKTREPIGSS